MPYLKAERRKLLAEHGLAHLIDFADADKIQAGDLNYIICVLADTLAGRDIGYANLRNILGEIHEAEAEIRRRLLVPYESMKKHDNGDVFFSDMRGSG